MNRSLTIKKLLLMALLLVLATLFVIPTILTVTNSLMTSQELAQNYGIVFEGLDSNHMVVSDQANLKLIPDMVSVKQFFTVLFQSPDYLYKFWNSVLLVVPIVLGQVMMASMAAYAFYRCRGKFHNIIFFLYIILMLMPYQVMLVPNFLVADFTGLLNHRLSVILPGMFAPFSVFLLTKFMRRIPTALIEAAKIDKASEWKIFWSVCLPQCKGAIFSVAILAFIDHWNMVEQPLILLNDVNMHPLSVYLARINAEEIGLAFAVATIYMIPPLLLFLYGEQYLIEGISHSGSVKG